MKAQNPQPNVCAITSVPEENIRESRLQITALNNMRVAWHTSVAEFISPFPENSRARGDEAYPNK